MAFEITPVVPAAPREGLRGNRLQVRNEGADIGDANVRVIDFVTDADRVIVTRGWGENRHVITVRRLPDDGGGGGGGGGGCIPLFLDNFDGTAGTLLYTHAPDIAPPGFIWNYPGGNGKLDGSGRAVINAGTTAEHKYSFASPIAIGSVFRIKLVCRMPG